MAKFYGIIGYSKTVETEPSVWEPVIIEKKYTGDINRYTKRYQDGTKVNADISLNAEISIVADSYLIQNYHMIRFVVLNDVAWEVTSIDPQFPRMNLSIGGLYNGPRSEGSETGA